MLFINLLKFVKIRDTISEIVCQLGMKFILFCEPLLEQQLTCGLPYGSGWQLYAQLPWSAEQQPDYMLPAHIYDQYNPFILVSPF